jgi:hypothetical protein
LSKTLRTIIQEKRFDDQLTVIGVSHKRLDEALDGMHVYLSQYPERMEKIPDTLLSIIKTAEFPRAPALRIFFTYDEQVVRLLHIEIIGDGSAEPFE